MRSPSPRVTKSYSDPAAWISLTYRDTIQPSAKTPTAAISTDSGDATPPPLPEALITPTTSGITKADENTGPMKPTDCATTSGRDSSLAPRRSYAGSGLAIGLSFSFFNRTLVLIELGWALAVRA